MAGAVGSWVVATSAMATEVVTVCSSARSQPAATTGGAATRIGSAAIDVDDGHDAPRPLAWDHASGPVQRGCRMSPATDSRSLACVPPHAPPLLPLTAT